jgi:hypothetical protein
VGISDGAVIACSSESCVQVVNKSIHQSRPRLLSPLQVILWMYVENEILNIIAEVNINQSRSTQLKNLNCVTKQLKYINNINQKDYKLYFI